jgi:rubrerythrin
MQKFCWACEIEAETGTEENPHPVPARFHSCKQASATANAVLEPRSPAEYATRYELAPGPDGETGDHAREFLRMLAFLGDEDFVAQEIHALVMLWMSERVFKDHDADRVTDFLAQIARRQRAGTVLKGAIEAAQKKVWYACKSCGDNISPDEGIVGDLCPSCQNEGKKAESGL